jgi:hypothetical protein
MHITTAFKKQVVDELQKVRTKFGGSDAAFAKQWSINHSVYSRLKNGETDGLLRDTQWLSLGRELNITLGDRKWNAAKTEVFRAIEEDVKFCQQFAKGMVLVDDCAIGKTFSAKYLSKTLNNCFYIDASQTKTKQLFIRAFAKMLGVEEKGKYAEVKANIKYYLRMLTAPVIIVDEAGDLEYTAFLELKELWNATEGVCGWYLMGADGLRAKIEKGIANKKVGFRELFSRYSDKFMKIVPADKQEKIAFYRKLITDVLSVNMSDKTKLPELVKKCLAHDATGEIGGLRRAETLLLLHNQQ